MIDEKKLIESFRASLNTGRETFNIDLIVECIEAQPKVGDWIPCSERLPELHRVDMQSSGEHYMISDSVIITDGESIGLTKYEVDDDDRKGWLECEFEGNEDVVAWMPLPEPYKGE